MVYVVMWESSKGNCDGECGVLFGTEDGYEKNLFILDRRGLYM